MTIANEHLLATMENHALGATLMLSAIFGRAINVTVKPHLQEGAYEFSVDLRKPKAKRDDTRYLRRKKIYIPGAGTAAGNLALWMAGIAEDFDLLPSMGEKESEG